MCRAPRGRRRELFESQCSSVDSSRATVDTTASLWAVSLGPTTSASSTALRSRRPASSTGGRSRTRASANHGRTALGAPATSAWRARSARASPSRPKMGRPAGPGRRAAAGGSPPEGPGGISMSSSKRAREPLSSEDNGPHGDPGPKIICATPGGERRPRAAIASALGPRWYQHVEARARAPIVRR